MLATGDRRQNAAEAAAAEAAITKAVNAGQANAGRSSLDVPWGQVGPIGLDQEAILGYERKERLQCTHTHTTASQQACYGHHPDSAALPGCRTAPPWQQEQAKA